MSNRLASAVSPYLRQHADNPVDWHPWGPDAFAEAERRDVPVLVSIGYATCHWCHVMARESFADPALASRLNEHFVAVKVDREEHPDVDAAYLAAASAFTPDLGWPLNVFVTPAGRPFYAGTYWPPVPVQGRPAFAQVLAAVSEAWRERRTEVETTGAAIVEALAAGAVAGGAPAQVPDGAGPGLGADALARVLDSLERTEDRHRGGFGGAPKFPVAPVLELLLDVSATGLALHEATVDAGDPGAGDPDSRDGLRRRARGLAERTLLAMARSPLRDRVEGGFFRYATRQDWSEPHYERMLYDNAQLLSAYTTLAVLCGDDDAGREAAAVAAGVGDFLTGVLQRPGGGFASAQDSESVVDGERVEGGYYALGAAERARQSPPALDEKVLAGWNGLAIEALARAGHHLARPDLTTAARRAADFLLDAHVRPDGSLVRVTIDARASDAVATLEDHGALAAGLLTLGGLGGEPGDVRYLRAGRRLVDAMLGSSSPGDGAPRLRAPQGVDPLLAAQGLGHEADPSEGAYPSGPTAAGRAAYVAHLLTGEPAYRDAALAAVAPVLGVAVERPLSFGATLRLALGLSLPPHQLAVVGTDGGASATELLGAARSWYRAASVVAAVDADDATALADDGFALLAGRGPGAYLCEDFVCRLPVRTTEALTDLLGAG